MPPYRNLFEYPKENVFSGSKSADFSILDIFIVVGEALYASAYRASGFDVLLAVVTEAVPVALAASASWRKRICTKNPELIKQIGVR